jgi:hypothetical protein
VSQEEKVARAIYAAVTGRVPEGWKSQPERFKDESLKAARAAIEAMGCGWRTIDELPIAYETEICEYLLCRQTDTETDYAHVEWCDDAGAWFSVVGGVSYSSDWPTHFQIIQPPSEPTDG